MLPGTATGVSTAVAGLVPLAFCSMSGDNDGVRAANHGLHFRISTAQRDQLQAEAAAQGLSIQQLLELKVFGELLPRQRKRRGVTGEGQEGLPLAMSA